MSAKHVLSDMGLGLIFAVAPLVAAAQTTGGEDPIDLFAKLMPVFSHPRCVNCHGAVNPEAEMAWPPTLPHGGGLIARGESCTEVCHDKEINWIRTAPPSFAFMGKNTLQLCKLQQQQAKSRGTGLYLSHLSTDALIGAAFEGFRGGASESADWPPMKRDDFVEAAAEWLEAGDGSCGGWVGTITQEEKFHSNYTYPISVGTGPSTTTIDETAVRTATVTRKDGEATAKTEMSGHQTIQILMRDIEPKGPCSSTATSNQDWNGKYDGGAIVRTRVAPDGNYVIRFTIPMEKTVSGSNTVSTGDCGPNPPASPPVPVELEWSARTFVIEDKLLNPRDRRHLFGTLVQRVLPDGSRKAKSQSWLAMSPAGVARADTGAPLVIEVTTTWDLTLEE